MEEAYRQAAGLPGSAYRLGGTGGYKIYPPPSKPTALIDLSGLAELKGTKSHENTRLAKWILADII